MNKRSFNEDSLSVETIMAVEKFKFEVNGEYCRLKNSLIKLRNEHDEKVALIEKQTRLTALCLMEAARKYDVAMHMTSLFRGCVDFSKPKKLKKDQQGGNNKCSNR